MRFSLAKFSSIIALSLISLSAFAQKKEVSFSFYGFVRNDLFVNSRLNQESVEGNFYFFPLNKQLDAHGNDLNAVANTGYYAMTSRLGVTVNGPRVWGALTQARIETDFGGFSGSASMLRLRQAYARLDWTKGHSLLMGQTWHPFAAEVTPRMLNLSTGMPFQPFSRSPQLRWWYEQRGWTVSAAALYQFQYASSGPAGKSTSYMRNAVVPEMVASLSYRGGDFMATVAANVLTLTPRTVAKVETENGAHSVKVNERVVTSSVMLAGEYRKGLLCVGAKTIYGQNLSHLCMNGGYGVVAEDPITQVRTYEGLDYSTSWLNVSYGKKYQVGTFVGFSKNMGSSRPLLNPDWVYGQGLNIANAERRESIDRLFSTNTQVSYNLPHWSFGVEYSSATAHYGTLTTSGRVADALPVTNHRVLLLMIYSF